MMSLASAMTLFFSAFPKIIGFVIILIVGWVIVALIELAVAAILRVIRFNELVRRSGFADFVRKMGSSTDSSGMIGTVAK